MTDNELYTYIDEADERVLAQFSDTSQLLHREGLHGFLAPALASSLFLSVVAGICYFLFSADGWLCAALLMLGFCIALTGTLLCAMHVRRARAARGTSLTVTDRRVIYRGTVPTQLFLYEIRSAVAVCGQRFSRVPFDLSLLDGRYLLLECEDGAVCPLAHIRDAKEAAALICSLLDKDGAL
ncbi:MAG: hypothetical protein IJE84_04620 [Clostridia bacterium]|nr:hypothetical protein [Clostridia bacterium]